MSIFHTQQVACPACNHAFNMQASDSVNADRRPDLRDAILDGSFQRETCPQCSEAFRLDPLINYLDIGRGQWLSVLPLDAMPKWEAEEADARDLFDLSYGRKAPASAREIGDTLSLRLVFGWAALREKLVARDAGLDDATLELTKLALIRSVSPCPLAPGVELRLDSVQDGQLRFDWVMAASEQRIESLLVPRSLYDEVAAAPQDWADIREAVASGPFVDAQKTWLAAAGSR